MVPPPNTSPSGVPTGQGSLNRGIGIKLGDSAGGSCEQTREFDSVNQAWEAKAQKFSQTFDRRKQRLEQDLKAAEAKHIRDLAERETHDRGV